MYTLCTRNRLPINTLCRRFVSALWWLWLCPRRHSRYRRKAVITTKYTKQTKDERLTKRTRLAHAENTSVGPNLCYFVYFVYFVV